MLGKQRESCGLNDISHQRYNSSIDPYTWSPARLCFMRESESEERPLIRWSTRAFESCDERDCRTGSLSYPLRPCVLRTNNITYTSHSCLLSCGRALLQQPIFVIILLVASPHASPAPCPSYSPPHAESRLRLSSSSRWSFPVPCGGGWVRKISAHVRAGSAG